MFFDSLSFLKIISFKSFNKQASSNDWAGLSDAVTSLEVYFYCYHNITIFSGKTKRSK